MFLPTNFAIKTMMICAASILFISACGGSKYVASVAQSNELIKLNQIGYLPTQSKVAVIPDTSASTFVIIDQQTDAVVYSGKLSKASNWQPANQIVKQADFTELNTPGSYIVKVYGMADSHPVSISENVYSEAHDASLKAYYFNRASSELKAEHASKWARPFAHPDTNVLVHASAASAKRPEGTVLSMPKGWYDAGDYNKYIVNSGISTYTLLAAYSHYPNFYNKRDLNIPESGDSIPDILDEIKWNIDWMIKMQDENDGGVYHKLTTLGFEGAIMPHNATSQRYVVQKGTGAALNFAAVLAKASRVYGKFSQFSSAAVLYKQAAIRAYEWAKANPNVVYMQPSDVSTGEYGDSIFADEFAWAAAELFVLSGDKKYWTDFKQNADFSEEPNWQNTMALGYITLLNAGAEYLSKNEMNYVKSAITDFSNSLVDMHNDSAFGVAMVDKDFVWGSNGVVLNKAMVLMQAYKATGKSAYKTAAVGLVDYVLGKNPTDYSYLTGFGVKPSVDPHHRQSYADDVKAPVPGFVVGGPQPGQQDGCDYTSSLPALSYVDHWCSYASNEVTINWNAPMVYMLASLTSKQ